MAGYRVMDPNGLEFKKRKYRPGETIEADASEVAAFRNALEKIPMVEPAIKFDSDSGVVTHPSEEQE